MNIEPLKHAKILIVDDDPTSLGVLFDYLAHFEFTVLVAQHGTGVFQLIEEDPPDIILLDVLMPDMDGFEVCRCLKEDDNTKDIPVIFMTALSETVDKLKGFQVGGVDYITKPFQHEEVLARVVAHLTIRNLQRQLQGQNVQLTELNASKDTFFSIISHDLRNPFNVILSLSQLLDENLESYSKDKIKTHIANLRSSAEKLYALLENLLTWSRIQRGAMEHHPKQIDIYEIAKHNIRLFIHTAEQKHITLRHSLKEKTFAYADYSMVDTVVRNLISNALKFTSTGGSVELSVTQRDGDIEMSVSDTGIGILEEYIPQLFRIDTKYVKVGTAGETGTGLGLILCKELVKKNGGSLWVESEVGKGSTFRFTLPKKNA